MNSCLSSRLIFHMLIISMIGLSCTNESKTYDDIAIADKSNTSEWLAYGRTHSQERFSPSKDINIETVSKLKVDWFLDLPNDVGLVSTPLVVDGILYFVGTMNIVRAVNAVTGELLWVYDPKVADAIKGKRQAGWVHNRGISFSHNKIFGASWDGRLFALDHKTGEELWITTTFDPSSPLYITGAPIAFKDKVLIGNGGTENGPSRGWVTAFDQETGEEAWKFYIVPGNPADGFENKAMEMAAKTWTGEWWKHGGGGNAWHGFTYDAELDVLYIGTGNGSPWNQKIRSPDGGDNLFLSSIVALDPDTGEYKWHYQTTPGETWDYNSNMDIVLTDLTIEGKETKVILHAPKNGFFYVINRETGKLISAEPMVKTTWASHIDMKTGRPVELPNARFTEGSIDITPSPIGAHSWHPMSHNPETGLTYIPIIHEALSYDDEGIDLLNYQTVDFRGGVGVNLGNAAPPEEHTGSLVAWDPVAQKPAWSIPQEQTWNAGTLTTAGNLVFQGESNGMFNAYNAKTGEKLWSFDCGLGISAPPITYTINGPQYISLLVGFGGAWAGLGTSPYGWSYGVQTRRLITFSLDGRAIMPTLAPKHFAEPVVDVEFVIDELLADKGASLYSDCGACHGPDLIAKGMAPDLRASSIPLSASSFASVVKDGILTSRAMPAFPQYSEQDLEALRHFIRKVSHESRDQLIKPK